MKSAAALAASSRRSGLTLIELIVVLTILVGLAGLIIPMMPGMLARTHTTTGAANCAEINKAVQTYESVYQGLPYDLDALTDATGAAVADYIVNDAGQLSMITLDANQAAALKSAGIKRLAGIYPTKAALAGKSPTFEANDGTTITIAASTKVVSVSEAAVESTLLHQDQAGSTYGDVYVIFGLGKASSMIGKAIADAPVHFAESEAENPNNAYGRFGLVFRIARGTGVSGTPTSIALERATFVGAVAMHDHGITGVDGHLQESYNVNK